jgi:hypothetical protein
MEFNIGLITFVVAAISSLVAEFIPGWADFQYKKQVMMGLNFLTPVAIWALICPAGLPLPITGVECVLAGFITAVGLGIAAMLENQGVWHLLTKDKVAAVRRG